MVILVYSHITQVFGVSTVSCKAYLCFFDYVQVPKGSKRALKTEETIDVLLDSWGVVFLVSMFFRGMYPFSSDWSGWRGASHTHLAQVNLINQGDIESWFFWWGKFHTRWQRPQNQQTLIECQAPQYAYWVIVSRMLAEKHCLLRDHALFKYGRYHIFCDVQDLQVVQFGMPEAILINVAPLHPLRMSSFAWFGAQFSEFWWVSSTFWWVLVKGSQLINERVLPWWKKQLRYQILHLLVRSLALCQVMDV